MPTVIGILGPNGLDDAPYTAESLAEAAKFEPDGVYTVTRTYKSTKTLLLDAHLDRMERSAELENMPFQLDRPRLRTGLRELVVYSGFPESRFRITAPRENPAHLVLTLEPFAGVPEIHKRLGVHTATVSVTRDQPDSKDNGWMAKRATAAENAPDAYEYLIVNADGAVLEGFGSNFYAVHEGEIFTAPDGTVLGGISRQIIKKVAPYIAPLNLETIAYDELVKLDEAFLTSSSRGVIPVVQIDEQTIGNGKPGPLAQKISAVYDRWVEDNLEEI